jgi:hypothetical protein
VLLSGACLCLLQFVGLLPRALGVRATPGGHYALRRSQYVSVLHAHLGRSTHAHAPAALYNLETHNQQGGQEEAVEQQEQPCLLP